MAEENESADDELDDNVELEEQQQSPAEERRDKELCNVRGFKRQLNALYGDVLAGFQDQADRSDDILDYWDLYNTKLTGRQMYAGNSKVFVPIIHDAIDARKTRFVNQVFPQSQRHVDVVAGEREPSSIVALLEHYIRKCRLRTQVMPALVKNGDIEGSYHVYVSWQELKRNVLFRVEKPLEQAGMPMPGTEEDDIEEEDITIGRPRVEVIADPDVCILPATADSVDEAIADGGSVSIIRRWSKATIRRMIKDGEIEKEAGDKLLKNFSAGADEPGSKDKSKAMVDAAGIKTQNGRKFALCYETWATLTYKKKTQLYKIYFAGEQLCLSCKRNPNWADRVPLLSAPVDKVQGSFKGISKLKFCADMQYAANDAVNEGMDSSAYSLMPIVMTDPAKNPRVGSMVLNMAAIWETSPNDTKFAQFPELWKSAFEIVNACRSTIFQNLSVSPAMIPQSTSTDQKRNQGEIAMEAQVDVLTTADAVTVLEEGILTPMLQWFVELDHQYRQKDITVKQYGQMGVRASMETIAPIQMDQRYEFIWYGVEAARNAQQIQQQIAMLNVVRGIPPQQYAPWELDIKPIITMLVDNTFGPRLAPEIFKDPRSALSQDPMQENGLLVDGFDIPAHPLDNDAQHIQAHQMAMQTGDVHGTIRLHIMKHLQALSQKTMQQQMQTQEGMPGVPGGAGPGVAGTPRLGAQPAGPRPNGQSNPAGAIHQDQMRGPGISPRR